VAASPFLPSRHVTVGVGDRGTGVDDVLLNVGNDGLGLRSIPANVWNGPMCVCDITTSTRTARAFVDHKFCLEANS